jgi:hypothetical protein
MSLSGQYIACYSWRNKEGPFVSITFVKLILIVAASFNGFGAAILWCSYGNCVSLCATQKSKGFYFGTFWFSIMAS